MPAPSAGYLRLTGRILDAVADMAAKHGSPGSLDALYALRCRAAGHMVRELLPALLHGPWKRARHPRRSRYAPGTHLVDHAWRFTAGRGGGYDPDGNVERAQMASFLARALDLLVADGTTQPHP